MTLPQQAGTLPLHGFVLAGGKSARMGADKARLRFQGRPMVELAVEKLRGFCAEVSIAGNRADLGEFAPVVPETRLEIGPGAGIEAGLAASRQPWAVFLPVDVPLVPWRLLRRWSEATLARQGLAASYLRCAGNQSAFCILRSDCKQRWSLGLDQGLRRLEDLLQMASAGGIWACDTQDLAGVADRRLPAHWFTNINTPRELALAEHWAQQGGSAWLEDRNFIR